MSCPGQLKKFIGNVFNYLKIIWLQDDLDTRASKLRSQKSSRYHLRGSDWKINPFLKGSGHCAKSCSNRQKSPHFLKGGRGGDTQLQLLLAQRQPLQRQVVQGLLQLLLSFFLSKLGPVIALKKVSKCISKGRHQFLSYIPAESPTSRLFPIKGMNLNVSCLISLFVMLLYINHISDLQV